MKKGSRVKVKYAEDTGFTYKNVPDGSEGIIQNVFLAIDIYYVKFPSGIVRCFRYRELELI